jgi:signal transduction histidine kinase
LARRTLRPIESALAAQTRFAGDASHELRTPLTAMKSELEVALRDPKLSAEEARGLLGSNLEEVGKLETLAAGLLRLARHEQTPLELVPVDLSVVSERALSRVATAAARRQVKLTSHVLGVVAGDAESLVELTVVLLDNAIKYSHIGDEVELRSADQGHTVDLIVRDHGAGIPAANLPHIFERFYRADSSRSKDTTPGYGLGLSIAAQIAQFHHATIDATSRFGAGSTFTVHLPSAS